jgi:hypothetical protein
MAKAVVKLENKKKKTSLLMAELIVVTLGLALILGIVTPKWCSRSESGYKRAKAASRL